MRDWLRWGWEVPQSLCKQEAQGSLILNWPLSDHSNLRDLCHSSLNLKSENLSWGSKSQSQGPGESAIAPGQFKPENLLSFAFRCLQALWPRRGRFPPSPLVQLLISSVLPLQTHPATWASLNRVTLKVNHQRVCLRITWKMKRTNKQKQLFGPHYKSTALESQGRVPEC